MRRTVILRMRLLRHSSGCSLHRRFLSQSRQPTVNSLADFEVNFGKRIGVGGFGSVHDARHRETQMAVAIKLMLPPCSAEPYGGEKDLATAIAHEQEVSATLLEAGLSHPHIVDLFGCCTSTGVEAAKRGLTLPSWLETDDTAPEMQVNYFVMERLKGNSLEKYIARAGGLRENEAQEITLALCLAIQHLHDLGIVHRDVKPDNVLYSEPASSSSVGAWKLIDFSAATTALRNTPKDTATLTEVVGTPGYIAPEILFKKEPYGFKSDVFSIGCTTHAMLSNMYLPRRHPRLGIMTNLPAHVSPEGCEFVTSLLEKNPNDRPSLAEAICHPWLQAVVARTRPT